MHDSRSHIFCARSKHTFLTASFCLSLVISQLVRDGVLRIYPSVFSAKSCTSSREFLRTLPRTTIYWNTLELRALCSLGFGCIEQSTLLHCCWPSCRRTQEVNTSYLLGSHDTLERNTKATYSSSHQHPDDVSSRQHQDDVVAGRIQQPDVHVLRCRQLS